MNLQEDIQFSETSNIHWPYQYRKMMSRDEMERHLSALRTDEILRLLRDDTLLEVIERYFATLGTNSIHQEVNQPSAIQAPTPTFQDQPKLPSVDKAKRPLNAFMAFRSMY